MSKETSGDGALLHERLKPEYLRPRLLRHQMAAKSTRVSLGIDSPQIANWRWPY
jgi:hypothetical protein